MSNDHPAVEQLLAYHGGELDEDLSGRVADHLVICADCMGLVLDLDAFPHLEPVAGEPDDLETRRAWRALSDRLTPGTNTPSRSARLFWKFAAAALLLIGFGLGFALLRQTAETERLAELLQTPQVDVPVIDLFPAGYLRGTEEQDNRVGLAATTETVVLILNVPDASSQAICELEIRDGTDTILWRHSGTRVSEYGNLTVAWPVRDLPAGAYHVLVSAGGHQIARFRVFLARD